MNEEYARILDAMLTNVVAPPRNEIENAIRVICKHCGASTPENFYWMASDVEAKVFIDKNARVAQGSVEDAWARWKKTGTKPPFHNEWGRYNAYMVAFMAMNDPNFGNTYATEMRAALISLARCSSWFLFEGGAVIIEQPSRIEILSNGIIKELEYRDGTAYRLTNVERVEDKDAEYFYSVDCRKFLCYEKVNPEPREAVSVDLGLCITEEICQEMAVFVVMDSKSAPGAGTFVIPPEDHPTRARGRNAMKSVGVMSELTVLGVLEREGILYALGMVLNKLEQP